MPSDSEEKLISEMTDVIRRAIAYGREIGSKETAERILKAAGQVTVAPETSTQVIAEKKPGTIKVRRQRKYPYGYVANNVKAALRSTVSGITFRELEERVSARAPDIDQGAIRNSIKQLVRNGDAINEDGRYRLKKEDENETPPSEESGVS